MVAVGHGTKYYGSEPRPRQNKAWSRERGRDMRITNLHVSRNVVDSTGQTQKKEMPQATGAGQATPEASFHTPSAEWAQWLARAQQEPEVRHEVVERVAARLASGEYLSAESAEGTAAAILAAQDEP